jgi:hypothetical protein
MRSIDTSSAFDIFYTNMYTSIPEPAFWNTGVRNMRGLARSKLSENLRGCLRMPVVLVTALEICGKRRHIRDCCPERI